MPSGHNRIRATIETAETPVTANVKAGNAVIPEPHNSQISTNPSVSENIDQNKMPLIAMMAKMEKLEPVLGHFLFSGLVLSDTRRQENRPATYTDAVRLHFAPEQGEDFILEIWLYSWFGRAIEALNQRSVMDLKTVLGDCIFDAMEASNERKKETGLTVNTNAVKVYFACSEGSGDCKLKVLLGFTEGYEIYPRSFVLA